MARSPSAKLLSALLLLSLCLSFQASAQTTIVHSFQTGVASKTASLTTSHAHTTINHNFNTPSNSPTATSTSKADDDDSPDGEACKNESGITLHAEFPFCEISGNGDFYGLGVRLGIYFTWLTSWIANNFLSGEMAGAFDTNSIFLLALLLVTFYYSIIYKLNAIDALVLLQLMFGFVFSVMSLWGYRTMYYRTEGPNGTKHFGGWGTHCRLLLMGAISVYAVWFWTSGLNDGLPSCAQAIRAPCGGLRTFMFADVDLYGPIRWIYFVGAAVCCLYYGIMLLAALAAATNHAICFFRNRNSEWELQQVDVISEGLNRNELSKMGVALSAFNFIWMVFVGCSVEFTLNFNHVQGVLGQNREQIITAGQLLPMIIGLFSFIRILYILFRDYYWEPHQQRKEEIHGLGMSMTGTTAATASPITPVKRGKFSKGSAKTGRQKSLAHRVITAWLPWLSTFSWWRGDVHNFELLSEGKETPFTPRTPMMPDMEMRRRVGGSPDEMESRRPFVTDEENTEYLGHEA